jgi:hypothetical protein
MDGSHGIITSTDNGETFWEAPITCDSSGKVEADFSSKGGPKDLTGTLEEAGIRWQDGNLWTRIVTTSLPPPSNASSKMQNLATGADASDDPTAEDFFEGSFGGPFEPTARPPPPPPHFRQGWFGAAPAADGTRRLSLRGSAPAERRE